VTSRPIGKVSRLSAGAGHGSRIVADSPGPLPNFLSGVQKRTARTHGEEFCGGIVTKEVFVEQVSAMEFTRLTKSNKEMSDHIVVLTAIVGAMVTRASVDYERLEECVNFAAKRFRAGNRSAFLEKASSVLHDLEAMQRALGVENRKRRNSRKRSVAALAREAL
jgi:hypothetical protein